MAGPADPSAPAAPAEGAAAAPDLAQFMDTFNTFQGDFQGFREELDGRFAAIEEGLQPEPEPPAPEPEPWAPDPQRDYQADGTLTPEAAQQFLDQFVNERVEQGVEARLTDWERGQQTREQDTFNAAYADQLEEKIPELADPATAKKYVDLASEWAQGINRPDLVGDPRVLETVYWAAKAQEVAAGASGAQQERETHLESGAGASPQPGQEPNLADGIVTAAQRRKF